MGRDGGARAHPASCETALKSARSWNRLLGGKLGGCTSGCNTTTGRSSWSAGWTRTSYCYAVCMLYNSQLVPPCGDLLHADEHRICCPFVLRAGELSSLGGRIYHTFETRRWMQGRTQLLTMSVRHVRVDVEREAREMAAVRYGNGLSTRLVLPRLETYLDMGYHQRRGDRIQVRRLDSPRSF